MALAFTLVILLAYFIKSTTGFAGALVSVPFLVLFFDIKFVVPTVSLIDMVSGFILFPGIRKHIARKDLFHILQGAVVGTLIGVYFFHSFESGTLKFIFGLCVILFALKILLQDPLSQKRMKAYLGRVFGVLGGITGSMFSTSGPLFTFYLEHQIKEKQVLRATLITAFLVDAVWRNSFYLATGVFEGDMYRLVLVMVPVLLVATFAGSHVHLKLSESVYRKAVGTILLVSGVLLLM